MVDCMSAMFTLDDDTLEACTLEDGQCVFLSEEKKKVFEERRQATLEALAFLNPSLLDDDNNEVNTANAAGDQVDD